MSKCRSCGKEIIWLKTRSGKAMPCDPEKVYFEPDPKGRATIVTEGGQVAKGILMDKLTAARFGDDGMKIMAGHISHFATCPFADRHRRKPK